MNIFYYRKIHINIIEFWKNIGKMSIPIIFCVIFAIIIKMIIPINTVLNLILQIAIYSTLYCIIMWKFGINSYEKDLLRIPLKKVFSK